MDVNVTAPEGATEIDVRAERYRAAFQKIKSGRTQWVEGTLDLVVVVKEAREFHQDHREYHRWLERNELQEISKQDLSALNQFAGDLVYARKLLEQAKSWSWQKVWSDRPNRTLSTNRKGPISRNSGSSKRKRAAVIPTCMRDDYEPGSISAAAKANPANSVSRRRGIRAPSTPPLERPVPKLRGLTPAQVDPDFKGTPLEFAAKYGLVNLQTKQEIEHHKRQEELMAWIGLVADHAKTANALLASASVGPTEVMGMRTKRGSVDPATLREWMGKPAKSEKLRAWLNSIERACESIREITDARQSSRDETARQDCLSLPC